MNMPWLYDRVTQYVAIDVSGLPVEKVSPVFSRTYGDKYIYLHRSEMPLPVNGRIVSWGAVEFVRQVWR